jgi:cation diffusion facilitator family transporter
VTIRGDTTREQRTAQRAVDEARKRNAIMLSMGTAASLTACKLGVALVTGSVGVLSEAVHSLTDLAAAGVVWYSLRHAAAPPDRRHRFGHEKAEDAAAIVEGVIITSAIAYVAWRAVQLMLDAESVDHAPLGLIVMLLSSGINLLVALHLKKVGRETDSTGVQADAQHLLGDVVTSVAVAGGLALVMLTGRTVFDPAAALIVAMVVVRIGLKLIWRGARVLLDESLPRDEIRLIEDVIRHSFSEVAGFHRLRTRKAGSRRHIDMHLTMDRNLPLWRAHEIADEVEQAIEASLPNVDVLTHIEPDSEVPPAGRDAGPSDR